MNREQIFREFEKIKLAFKRTDGNFQNVDIHVGEHLRRLLALQKTVDEVYLNAMTRDRMWTALMEMIYKKGLFTKEEYDAELDLLNKAIEKATAEDAEKRKQAEEAAAAEAAKTTEVAGGTITTLSDVPAIPVEK